MVLEVKEDLFLRVCVFLFLSMGRGEGWVRVGVFEEGLGVGNTIPLQLEGVVSYFEYALPTSAEFEDPESHHLELTAESPAWNPYDKDFAQLEESYLDWQGHVISVARSHGPRNVTEICRLQRGAPLET